MLLTTAFNKLLSLQGAYVRRVLFEFESLRIKVAPRSRRHRCPKCTFSTTAGYDKHSRRWRHIALGKWKVIIEATVYRLKCPRHGVLTEAVSWASPGSRFTLDFEDLVAWLTREMNITAVTRLVHISWLTVGDIVKRVVRRKLPEGRLERLYLIGLDEVSYRKGHKYISIIADHQSGSPVWMAEGRSQATIAAFFDTLGPERCAQLTAVSMDMSAAYFAEVQNRAPNAQIAFDPFHVVQLGNKALQEIRRTEAREHSDSNHGKVLKGARWTLLKASEDLKVDERLHLAEVARLNARVYRGYLLKEELRALYSCSSEEAEVHLEAWMGWACRSRLKPFQRLARTLRKYKDGVLAAIKLGLTNARLEGINNKIGVLKHRAYGFHSAAALIALVYLCCTKLPLSLPI